MRTFLKYRTLFISIFFVIAIHSTAQKLNDFTFKGLSNPQENIIRDEVQFNGYTNHWHNDYKEWFRYGNLFKMSILDVERTIAQSKIDIAEDLQVPGLAVQEGFINGLLSETSKTLDNPSLKELQWAICSGNVLVFTDPSSEAGKQLIEKFVPNNSGRQQLKSYQFGAANYNEVNAFILENGTRKIFVVASTENACLKRVKELLENTKKVLSEYDLHKGWFGAETFLKKVTCTPGHPLEVIGKGMNEGNTWIIFSGGYDYWMKDELAGWIKKANLPVVTDVGSPPVYGCMDYKGLQIQDMETYQSWIDFAREKHGYVFRPVYDTASDPLRFDGYMATEGDKKEIDKGDEPFAVKTGPLLTDLVPSMVLFIKKGEKLTRKLMWDAIMGRREVGILDQGKMMGPDQYRTALQLLLLDRVYLDGYFGYQINLQAEVQDYTLNVKISNTYPHSVSGKLDLQLPPEVKMDEAYTEELALPANSSKIISVKIRPLANGMNFTNLIAVNFKWGDQKKSTITIFDMPPAISVHCLLYGIAPLVKFPVSIHNFSSDSPFRVKVQVFAKNNPAKAVFSASQNNTATLGKSQNMDFDLKLAAGDYTVKVSALGVTTSSQLGVGKAEGAARAYAIDLNSDGVNEYRLENDSVQVTLLSTGARVIEYIVKSRKDNILFKLWPEKPIDDRRSSREKEYYPFGGFEDFLGQPGMETHQVFDATMVKDKGDYVQVKMVTDFYGNKLEKIFTLYGNSPLLEIRFALDFKNPEANVIGPQPILELGAVHGPEDVFTIPAIDGLEQYRMKPEKYYGHVFTLKEGWNAGYDEKEDITFVGAFPVDQPLFLHMWMNHPGNEGAHYYYAEFQPWVPITQNNTMYFSYYMWGAGGKWENGLAELRKRNLITVQ